MTDRFLIDATDRRFFVPENADVLEFIRRTSPFAHPDVGSLLFELGYQIPGVSGYCPDTKSCAYVVLCDEVERIFAIAFGQRGLAFRLSAPAYAQALATGGTAPPEIGTGWVKFDPWDHCGADRQSALLDLAMRAHAGGASAR